METAPDAESGSMRHAARATMVVSALTSRDDESWRSDHEPHVSLRMRRFSREMTKQTSEKTYEQKKNESKKSTLISIVVTSVHAFHANVTVRSCDVNAFHAALTMARLANDVATSATHHSTLQSTELIKR